VTIVVGVETLLLALLSLLVLGLLRSHAEILRRLERAAPSETLPAPGRRAGGRPALDVAGSTPAGETRSFALSNGAPDTLLAFVSSGCSSCAALLDGLRDAPPLPGAPRLILVTKDPDVERPRVFAAAARSAHVVMSTRAWDDYRVPGSPYFLYVDGAQGVVVGEGSAPTWERVASLVGEMLDDGAAPEDARDADTALAAAGIHAGDASLYPGRTWDSSR
jgi:hypothetical protein